MNEERAALGACGTASDTRVSGTDTTSWSIEGATFIFFELLRETLADFSSFWRVTSERN